MNPNPQGLPFTPTNQSLPLLHPPPRRLHGTPIPEFRRIPRDETGAGVGLWASDPRLAGVESRVIRPYMVIRAVGFGSAPGGPLRSGSSPPWPHCGRNSRLPFDTSGTPPRPGGGAAAGWAGGGRDGGVGGRQSWPPLGRLPRQRRLPFSPPRRACRWTRRNSGWRHGDVSGSFQQQEQEQEQEQPSPWMVMV